MGYELNLTLGQNDFTLGWFFVSLSIYLMNTRHKEIAIQPRLKPFLPEIKLI